MRETLSGLVVLMLAAMATNVRSDVVLFGHGDARQAASDYAVPGAGVHAECSNCMFGLDGHNDMGNGLKAIYGADWEYSGHEHASRDQWLGISGDFGAVKLGHLSATSKSAGVLPDPAYRPSSMNSSGLSSDYAGYTADADDLAGEDGGVGLSYENAGLLVFTDYISGRGASDDPAYSVGAKLATDNFAVFGQYRFDTRASDNQLMDVPPDSSNIWFLGGSLTVGPTSIYAGYGRGNDSVSSGVIPGYDAWEIIGVRSLGKLTSIYAGYSGTGCSDKNSESCDKSGASVVGDDKFSLGIRHNF